MKKVTTTGRLMMGGDEFSPSSWVRIIENKHFKLEKKGIPTNRIGWISKPRLRD